MVVRRVKATFVAILVLVITLVTTVKTNALQETNDTEIAYFDYRGIYLSPSDYQEGESLTYAEYYDTAFGRYVDTGIIPSRFSSDVIKVVFIPINYVEVNGFSGFGVDKLEFIKVSYNIVVNSSDIITQINLFKSEIYIRNIIQSYVNVEVYDIEEFNLEFLPFFDSIIASMPNIQLINDGIYYDGYNEGYSVAYDELALVGIEEGYNNAIEKVFYDGFVGTQYDDKNSFLYNEGFNDGVELHNDFSFIGLLSQVFVGLGSFLAINLLPGISIGAIIAVPLVFGIIYFILGKRRGDD